jgi:hypothetical protein
MFFWARRGTPFGFGQLLKIRLIKARIHLRRTSVYVLSSGCVLLYNKGEREVFCMLSDLQMKNYEFFKEHLDEYLRDPLKRDKHAVIYDLKLQGLFDTFEAACAFAYSASANGFVVQQIIDESEVVDYLYSAVG